MIQAYPKTKDISVGDCPECGGKLFEEIAEKTYGSPDNESVYYEKFIACVDCPYQKDYVPEEKEFEIDENPFD